MGSRRHPACRRSDPAQPNHPGGCRRLRPGLRAIPRATRPQQTRNRPAPGRAADRHRRLPQRRPGRRTARTDYPAGRSRRVRGRVAQRPRTRGPGRCHPVSSRTPPGRCRHPTTTRSPPPADHRQPRPLRVPQRAEATCIRSASSAGPVASSAHLPGRSPPSHAAEAAEPTRRALISGDMSGGRLEALVLDFAGVLTSNMVEVIAIRIAQCLPGRRRRAQLRQQRPAARAPIHPAVPP